MLAQRYELISCYRLPTLTNISITGKEDIDAIKNDLNTLSFLAGPQSYEKHERESLTTTICTFNAQYGSEDMQFNIE